MGPCAPVWSQCCTGTARSGHRAHFCVLRLQPAAFPLMPPETGGQPKDRHRTSLLSSRKQVSARLQSTVAGFILKLEAEGRAASVWNSKRDRAASPFLACYSGPQSLLKEAR